MSAIQIWLKIKGVMIPKKGQVRRLGLWISHSFLAFFLNQAAHAVEMLAFTENLPPLNFEENGQIKGFSVELVNLMAKESGIGITIQVMPWARAYQTTLETPNSIIFTIVRNADRENLFLWIGPIAKRKIYLYKLSQRNDIKLSQITDAKKYRIGAVRESASTKLLISQGFEINKELDLAKDDFINMKKLLSGRIDLTAALDWAAYFALKKEGGSAEQISPAILLDQTHEYFIGLNKNTNPELYEKLSKAFEKIKKNGQLKKLQQQHMPSQENE